jgi:hypothetical protein
MKNLVFLFNILILNSFNFTDKLLHIDFIESQENTAKEYILNAFKDHKMVIVCERHHREFTKYKLFLEIVRTPYFINNLGDIFAEVPLLNMQNRINRFLISEIEDSIAIHNQLTSIVRDYHDITDWDACNLPWFLRELQELNRSLPESKKITFYHCDREFNWEKCQSTDDYLAYRNTTVNRDSIIARNVIKEDI